MRGVLPMVADNTYCSAFFVNRMGCRSSAAGTAAGRRMAKQAHFMLTDLRTERANAMISRE
jgi:hypothetical protein